MELVEDGPDRWRIPKSGGMRVDGLVFASESLILKAKDDRALDQVANVAHLPGIVEASIAMPDIHWGYGFPIGGVAATDVDNGGVISPGGVGFDIGCGVRLISSNITIEDARSKLELLVSSVASRIPRGVGQKGLQRLDEKEFPKLLELGAEWAVRKGIGRDRDLELCEEGGRLKGADPTKVSTKAAQRGAGQLGSLGAGNHFVEIQAVDRIYDSGAANAMGLAEGMVCVMIHTGSRGLGHQVCTEELRKVESEMKQLGIEVPDRQLACAPVSSKAGAGYVGAMEAAANFARANRHVIADEIRGCFEEVFRSPSERLGLDLVYDVSHNVAQIEEHDVDGRTRRLCVHRKGATKSLGPGSPHIPDRYKESGQPVLIPGSMGTASWVLAGANEASELAFSSTCHGAGRAMSRKAAVKRQRGDALQTELEGKGILVRAKQMRLLAEEAPYAYKDVDEVVEVCDRIGLSRKVARLRPVAVVKG